MPEAMKGNGGFMRAELKKDADGKWRGKAHARFPCEFTRGLGVYAQTFTNWCSIEKNQEIDVITDKRIEGVSNTWKIEDCRK